MKARVICLIAVCSIGSTFAEHAWAQPSTADKALATRMYEDAEKLMASGDFAGACPKYAESQQRDPQLGTLLHLADCYEKAGKLMSAWVSFNEAVEAAQRKIASGVKEPRGQTAKDRAAALEGKLSNLVITVANGDAPGFEVRQNGAVVSRAVWGSAMPVDPGSYAITAQATGKKPWKTNAEVATNGLRVEVAIPVLEDQGAGAGATPGMPPPQGTTAPGSTATGGLTVGGAAPAADEGASKGNQQRLIGWIVTGVGVVGLGAGAGFGLMSKSKVSDRDKLCPTSACTRTNYNQYVDLESEARSAATISNVAFVVGGIAVAAGVVLVLTAPSHSPTAATLHVGPWAGANSTGAMVGGAF